METAENPRAKPSLDELFNDAEHTLRQTLETFTDWGEQARHVAQDRPGVILASLSIAGFMTGLVMRRGRPSSRELSRSGFVADPMLLFLTGAIAGFAFGPLALRELARPEERGSGATSNESERTTERPRAEPRTLRRRDREPSSPSDIEDFNRR